MDPWRSGSPRRSALLLLGTYHMANPNLDYANVQARDVLTEEGQHQIRGCVDRLKRFRPTKVALEVPADRADALNRTFSQYRAGNFELTRDETHQLGFRVAELGHERVYAIDWMGGRFGLDRVSDFARSHGQATITDRVFAAFEQRVAEVNALIRTAQIADVLRAINDPDRLRQDHQLYLALAAVGEGDEYVGADWLAGWYERNLKIFANLTRITDSAEDRILVIIGSGHVPLLTHVTRDSGAYDLESVAGYLH